MKFTVYGTPRPQGSMRAFAHKTTGKVVTVSDNAKTKPWRQEIARTALEEKRSHYMNGNQESSYHGVVIKMTFCFARPKSVKEHKRPHMTVKPDIDKLARAVLDACTGILFPDDANIIRLTATKRYEEPERVEIEIE
jgi:Holliday junction resolvase RusA-like endonuclease